ncbi:MAG: hypothetical protein RBU29_16350 [bacterium]|jgi:hypothetical protein|nr:hypothetical protein [bacterium]
MKAKKRANALIILQNLSDRLVWMEVKKETEKLRIVNCGVEPFFAEEDGEEHVLPTESPLDRLKASLETIAAKKIKSSWYSRKPIVYLAPGHRLTARFLQTPPTSAENIRDLVAFEVAEALQVPIDNIAWDMILSSAHTDQAEKSLLWIATRREYIDGVLSAWPSDDLFPTQVTTDLWAYYEFLLNSSPEWMQNPTILVCQEGNRASISVVTREAIYFTRSVTLARTIRTGEESSSDALKERQLALEIQRTMSYVADRFPPDSIQDMILFGFDLWDPSSLEALAKQYNYAIHRITINDLHEILEGDTSLLQPEHLSSLCVAYCQVQLGQTGPTLLEPEEEKFSLQAMVPEAALPSPKFLATTGAMLGTLLILWVGQWFWYHNAVNTMRSEGKTLLKLADQLKKEETALRSLSQSHMDYSKLFIFLAENMPEGVLVKNISIDTKTGVDLVLVGGNHQTITGLIEKMNSSPYFRTMVENRAVNEKDGFTVYLKGKLKVGA